MNLYLKNNIKFAPYVWNWYAWSHLIAPHTAGANIVERHMKIMSSFIENPQLHYEAIHISKMIGGPFINLSPEKKHTIEQLSHDTKINCANLINLNADIKSFDKHLLTHAKGESLENLYLQAPSSLRGLFELVYDLNNNPQIRFIEPLLYKKYYNTSHQSLVLAEIKNDNRSFCLSTPFIKDEEELEIKIPFSSTLIDKLITLQSRAGSPHALIDELNLADDQIPLFLSFFTDKKNTQSRNANYTGPGVRVRYLGHACVLLQTANISILIDPTLGYNYDGKRQDRFTYEDMPDTLDYVVITHNHQDHFLFETLLQLRTKIKNIIVPNTHYGSVQDPSIKLILKHMGFENIILMEEFDRLSLNDHCLITALPFLGEHGDLNIQSKRSYHISLYEHSFLFLADSNNLDPQLYEYIFDYIGKVETIFIGMECKGAPASWLYGPLFTNALDLTHDRSRRLSGSNCKKAWQIIKASHCKNVNIYAMGMEPWLGYIMAIHYDETSLPITESNRLLAICEENNIQAMRLYGKKEWIY